MKDIFKSLYIDLIKVKATIGEIREWKGIKYQKQTNGTWKPLVKRGLNSMKKERFGKNFSEYKDNPKGAIEVLLKTRQGQVIGAYQKEGLGKIDIIWGNNERGLQHIRKRHFIEQDDFQSLEDMTEKIVDVLENGEIGRFYDHGRKVDIKTEKFKVILTKTLIYDEEDNFEEKVWVLTSFDFSKIKEDKIKKNLDCTYPGNSVLQLGLDLGEANPLFGSIDSSCIKKESRTSTTISSHSFLSEHKDTLRKSLEQHLDDIFFEKAKKGYDIGTIKEFGGKKYIKTDNGWKYYSNKGQSQKKEIKQEKDNPTAKYLQQMKEWAKKASVVALKNIINNKDTKDFVKEIAKEELLKRKQKLKETEAQIKEEEMGSKQVKKITQTYVKVNGDQIIIKMKNESQYKATKGSFKLESEVGEDLVSFKKKVIESYSNKEKNIEQLSKKEALHFKNEDERTEYLKKANNLNELTKEQQNELLEYKKDYRKKT